MSDDRVTFWFGCNMLRHAEMIRLSIILLERVGYDVSAVGGPAYCCGTVHDDEPRAASTMAARTVARLNEGATRDGRDKVITWCPSCHMHMSDIMAPGNAAHFDIAHVSEVLADRAAQLARVMNVPVNRRVLLHRHVGFATHVAINSRVAGVLARISGLELVEGPAHPGHMCSALAAKPGALAAAAEGTWSAAAANGCDTVCTVFHSCHRELAALDGKENIRIRNWVHLVAEAMGIDASDAYRDWRAGGASDVAAIERAGGEEISPRTPQAAPSSIILDKRFAVQANGSHALAPPEPPLR
jgi:Fe-S oxidoreductase